MQTFTVKAKSLEGYNEVKTLALSLGYKHKSGAQFNHTYQYCRAPRISFDEDGEFYLISKKDLLPCQYNFDWEKEPDFVEAFMEDNIITAPLTGYADKSRVKGLIPQSVEILRQRPAQAEDKLASVVDAIQYELDRGYQIISKSIIEEDGQTIITIRLG